MHYTGITGLRRIAIAVTLAALALGLDAPDGHAQAIASLPTAQPLALGGSDDQPTTAWKRFCQQLPSECRVDLSEAAAIALTPAIWELLTITNGLVNTIIRPMDDLQHWGVEDQWNFPDDGFGDCEDYQLLKRKLLVEAGLPRRAMRMTVVLDKGEGHAVLTIRTDRGDFILDNKANRVMPWNETGYEFVKREASDSSAWVALGGGPVRTVVASRSPASTEATPSPERPAATPSGRR